MIELFVYLPLFTAYSPSSCQRVCSDIPALKTNAFRSGEQIFRDMNNVRRDQRSHLV